MFRFTDQYGLADIGMFVNSLFPAPAEYHGVPTIDAGLTDYTAENVLNYLTGQAQMPSLPSVYLALFTTAPTSDAAVTGAVEVTGGSYARVQIAGTAATNNTTSSSSNVLHFATVPTWLVGGMSIRDVTTPSAITVGTTISGTGTGVVNMSANAAATVGNGDTIVFSAFAPAVASAGSEPSVTPAYAQNTGSIITFIQATANWGTVVAWGLFDGVTGGNCLTWDYLGNYKWIPFTMTLASPGVITTDSTNAYPNGTSVVMTNKPSGGVFPTTGSSLAGILTTAGLSGATFNVGVNTTGAGEGLIRQVLQQSIPINVQASFATSTFTIYAA